MNIRKHSFVIFYNQDRQILLHVNQKLLQQYFQAQVSFYNAIGLADEYLPEYQGEIDIYLQGTDNDPVAQALAIGQYTESVVNENGDFSLDVLISGQNQSLLKNHLLSLPENSAKTVFLYGDEEYIDEDGDGDVDKEDVKIVAKKTKTAVK